MKIKYDGTSDFQEFSADDFKKAGVEGKKTRFAQGVEQEVPDEVGAALTSKEGIFGDFSFSEVKQETETHTEEDSNEPTTEGTATDDAPKSTGRGSSTRGTTRSTP